jgi:hypothetical protein
LSQTSLAPFESTIQTSNIWLNDIRDRLEWPDQRRAYHALSKRESNVHYDEDSET